MKFIFNERDYNITEETWVIILMKKLMCSLGPSEVTVTVRLQVWEPHWITDEYCKRYRLSDICLRHIPSGRSQSEYFIFISNTACWPTTHRPLTRLWRLDQKQPGKASAASSSHIPSQPITNYSHHKSKLLSKFKLFG